MTTILGSGRALSGAGRDADYTNFQDAFQLSVVDGKIKANSKKRQPLKEWMDRAQEAEEQIKALEHELKEQEEKLMRARKRVENL